jgi:hypothetical protein
LSNEIIWLLLPILIPLPALTAEPEIVPVFVRVVITLGPDAPPKWIPLTSTPSDIASIRPLLVSVVIVLDVSTLIPEASLMPAVTLIVPVLSILSTIEYVST